MKHWRIGIQRKVTSSPTAPSRICCLCRWTRYRKSCCLRSSDGNGDTSRRRDGGFIYPCSFSAQMKNFLASARKSSPALLPFKGVLPRGRHHPFSRQPERRYNTLDFAKAKSCAKRLVAPLDTLPFSRSWGPIPENRCFQNGTHLLKNAKRAQAFHRRRMKNLCPFLQGKWQPPAHFPCSLRRNENCP